MEQIKSRGNEIFTKNDEVDTDVCPKCHGTGMELFKKDVYGNGEKYNWCQTCSACGGITSKRVSEEKLAANIPYKNTLADFDWKSYEDTAKEQKVDTTKEQKIVERFIEHFTEFEAEGLGLYISSKTRGSGKTFLASAIGNELIKRYAMSVRFENASDLLDISNKKYEDGRDPLADLISCRVLILDDLGQKATGRDWLSDVLYKIIDKRCTRKRITIITSNVVLKELDFDDRIVDRLNKMTVSVKIPEVCIRAREANQRKKEILNRLLSD